MFTKKMSELIKRLLLKTFLILLMTVVIFGSLIFGTNNIALAQGGITLGTSYPGITVKPGETVEFPLIVVNSSTSPKNIELSVQSIPNGWEGYFQGMGKKVHRVFVTNGDSQDVSFKVKIPSEIIQIPPIKNDNNPHEVKIPSETYEGSYKIVINANGDESSDSLTLDLKISKGTRTQGKLVALYPELQGPGSAIFKFRVDLANNSSKDQSYSLGAKVDQGWEVLFKPSYEDKQIASISLGPDKSQGLDIEVKPPKNIKAGKYTIPISAVSANETITSVLQVIITGTYKLELSTPTGQLNIEAYAGEEKPVTLKVTNNGSADLKEVSFSSWEPANWSVTFKPEKIDVLPSGQSQEVKAYIKPAAHAIAGDYVVKLTAGTPGTGSDAEFRVMVKTPTVWGITGIAIIAFLGGGLGLYRTFKVKMYRKR